jgi:orotidine-5'-phosphate decarboxylase
VERRPAFIEQLKRRWVDAETLLCVGLDPDMHRLPAAFYDRDQELFEFCAAIADATAEFVCAFKPQIAYFAARGAEQQLVRLIDHLHQRHPRIPVILDAKRGDIGATARLYAEEAFERYGADAVTVNPYLGRESIEPFLEYADRGVILLSRTSNEDSGWLQNHPPEAPVFLRVAAAARSWNQHGNVMLVAGATYAEDLRRIREVAGDMPLLVPGVGAQGGELKGALEAGLDSQGLGLVINASRSVLYAGSDDGFADAARAAAATLCNEIRRHRAAVRSPVRQSD